MPHAIEQDTRKQNAFEPDKPAATGVFRITPAEAGAQPLSVLQGELALLLEVPYHDARKRAICAFEREYVRELLDRCGGNVSLGARTSGLDRVYLHRLLRKHGLRGVTRRSYRVKRKEAATTNDGLTK